MYLIAQRYNFFIIKTNFLLVKNAYYNKKRENTCFPLIHINFKTEATVGFEPTIDGFADRCLRPLSHVRCPRLKHMGLQ